VHLLGLVLYHTSDDGHDDARKNVETPISTSSSASSWLFIHIHQYFIVFLLSSFPVLSRSCVISLLFVFVSLSLLFSLYFCWQTAVWTTEEP
jgi:hypothetical protein